MSAPEFSRPADLRYITPQPVELEATPEEREALAARFGLVAIAHLEATLKLHRDGDIVHAEGRLLADIVQSCAVSGDDLPVSLDERLAFRFIPETPVAEEELELDQNELEEIPYSGGSLDLGEAVAQSLALAIDPYATGPEADRVRKEAGISDEAANGPFAALAALKKE